MNHNRTEKLLALLAEQGARLHAILTRLTLHEDVAEDLMQELFIRLAQSPGFNDAKEPFVYALRTATNLAFDWHRWRKKTQKIESDLEQVPAAVNLASRVIVNDEEFQLVIEAIGRLSRKGRELVVMRYLDQQSYETIALRMGKTPHQVRGLCNKAIKQLRKLLGEDEPTYKNDMGGTQNGQ